MEFGDIVYFLLMLGFLVFGIFNDSKKKKKNINQSTPPLNPDVFPDKTLPPPLRKVAKKAKKLVPVQTPPPPKRVEFQSSMDLVTDFEGESSLKGTIFDYKMPVKAEKSLYEPHPILNDLTGEDGSEEIRKAIIYSEILKRKY